MQTLQSDLAKELFGGGVRYTGVQFHFHAGSEHTVDGERYDLEMHTVHVADDAAGGFGNAALGIIFSVDKFSDSVTDA